MCSLAYKFCKKRIDNRILNGTNLIILKELTRNLSKGPPQWTKGCLCTSFSTFPYGIHERLSPKYGNIWPLATKSRCLLHLAFWYKERWIHPYCPYEAWSQANRANYLPHVLCLWTRERVPHTQVVSNCKIWNFVHLILDYKRVEFYLILFAKCAWRLSRKMMKLAISCLMKIHDYNRRSPFMYADDFF